MRRTFCLGLSLLFFVVATTEAQNLNSARDYVKRGVTRFSKGDIEGAIADLNKALELNPRFAEAHFNRGKARRAKGELDGAIEDFEKPSDQSRTANNNRDISQRTSIGVLSGRTARPCAASMISTRRLRSTPKIRSLFKRGRALRSRVTGGRDCRFYRYYHGSAQSFILTPSAASLDVSRK